MYDKNKIAELKKYLVDKKLTISVAESVTAGHIQAALSSADEAARFFQGGITVYNMGQKTKHLKINPIHGEASNCVSKDIAIEMALNVTELFLSEVGIGITGYASPIPEIGIKKVFAWFALTRNKKLIYCNKLTSNYKNSIKVQADYALQVIEISVEILKKIGH